MHGHIRKSRMPQNRSAPVMARKLAAAAAVMVVALAALSWFIGVVTALV